MGTGSSHFLAEEAKLLQDFSAENAWAYDDERWLPMLHFKEGLHTVTPGVLVRDLQDTARRLCECLREVAHQKRRVNAVCHLQRYSAIASPIVPSCCVLVLQCATIAAATTSPR
jgi:hypothetical protein